MRHRLYVATDSTAAPTDRQVRSDKAKVLSAAGREKQLAEKQVREIKSLETTRPDRSAFYFILLLHSAVLLVLERLH